MTTPIVDSALSPATELRRFRESLKASPTRLSGAASSAESLINAVAAAVERNDADALARMALSTDEFAYLYYPTNPQSRPPYELSPQIMWLQMSSQSDQGLHRLLRAYGGKRLGVTRWTCDSVPHIEGDNRILAHCRVTHSGPEQSTVTEPLFAAIIERGGRYKILSYS
ncbi:MAG: hypothetical protein ACR2KM_03770, partial [Gemmatimonadaceae bacterium]